MASVVYSDPRCKGKKVLRRLTQLQRHVLEDAFEREGSAAWDSALISSFAARLALSHTKVYKWNWEKRKKIKAQVSSAQPISSPLPESQ